MKINKLKTNTKITILAVILIAIFCFALTPKTLQNDTFYTIKIGESILQNGIDMKEHFAWHENLPYSYPHWAYDIFTYLIYNVGGMQGIYIATAILSMTLGILLYFVNSKIGKNKIISFFITLGAMYLLKDYIAARAQLVTFILFVLTVYFIERFLETKKKRYAAALIIIPILIANLHAAVFPVYFVLYLPYIAEYLIALIAEVIIYKKIKIKLIKDKIYIINKKQKNLDKLEKLENELKQLEEQVDKIKIKRTKELQNPYKIRLVKNDNVKWLILIMIVCAFMGLLTPIGDTPYTYLIKTMKGNTTLNINEHLPMTIAKDVGMLCTIVLFLAILIFTKVKIKLSDLFMLGGLCYLMLATKRQATLFILIGSIILTKLLAEMIKIYGNDIKIKESVKSYISGVITVSTILIVIIFSYDMLKSKKDDQFIDENDYPVQACDYILENIDLSKARFYNEYNYGSYMLYRGIPVFIDSRADVYDPQFNGRKNEDIFLDFINTSNIGLFYEFTMNKYDITHVICYEGSKMNMIITETKDKHYKELYNDGKFVIYERIKE